MKKIIIILLCAVLLLSGCAVEGTAEIIEVNTTQNSPLRHRFICLF